MECASVFVVLLNWNGLADTLECLNSLRKQDYPQLRIIVVDNASAADEASCIEQQFTEVTVLRQTENLGFCGGNNVGIKHALAQGAEYVLVLNNDTIAPPELISELMRKSVNLPRVGAVSPVILCHPETSLIWYAGSAWEAETAGFRHLLAYQDRKTVSAIEPFETEYACGCCLLVSASVLRQVGLMDERYFAYYDEADWSSRMKARGFECYVIPTAHVFHKVSRTKRRPLVTYFLARNRLLWMHDHLPFRKRLASYPYLAKEIIWSVLNAAGIRARTQRITRSESRLMLTAMFDFARRRFGAAPAKIMKLNESRSSEK